MGTVILTASQFSRCLAPNESPCKSIVDIILLMNYPFKQRPECRFSFSFSPTVLLFVMLLYGQLLKQARLTKSCAVIGYSTGKVALSFHLGVICIVSPKTKLFLKSWSSLFGQDG